ncbi:Histidine kinase [Mesorhizobium ventifaucium]|uniref:Histidine kinase n=1 Tax=Mesorhizobium ventifaucium TaxID=666020 RepID=A0ABN8KF70_9HYPH|nr:Histidine kinase [Mesorhizobium ventifaucium]
MRYTSSHSSDRRLEEPVAPFSAAVPPLCLSSIVHDFNSLLTPVLTILEELQARRAGTSRQLRKLDGAIYCAFRAKILARELLDFTSPRQARPEPVDIHQMISLLEAALESVLPSSISLEVDIANSLPLAFVDQPFVERALLNLVLNARDAMPEGGEITIAAASELPPVSQAGPRKLMIRLSVANRGISPEAPSMVGHPHFSTQTNRTSLVLAIVKQLMESLEGGLTLTNTARQGTTVDLWLPAISACSAD